MRSARLWLLMILLVAAGSAVAQPSVQPLPLQPVSPAASCRAPTGGALDAAMLLVRTRDFTETTANRAPPVLRLETGRFSAASGGSLRMRLERASTELKDNLPAWQQAYFIGAARTAVEVVFKRPRRDGLGQLQPVPPDVARSGIFVELMERQDENTTLNVHMPANRSGWFGEEWHVVVAACTAEHRLIGYGIVTVTVSPLSLSRTCTFGGLIVLWLLAGYVAARENKAKLHQWWIGMGGAVPAAPATWWTAWRPEHRWRLLAKGLRAMDPIFISQDALGAGSLGRLQLLVLSFAVIGVVFYVFLRTGAFAGLSNDILALLGITAGGSTLARAAALRQPFSAQHRRILFGNNVIARASPMPTMRDVLAGCGELDVTRLQAFAFTGFAVVALVVNGVADLASFELPKEMLSVLGLSQGIYVAGKLLPDTAETTLRSDLDSLRREAAAAVQTGADTPAFLQARRAAGDSLEQAFGERFDRARFLALPASELA